MPVSAAPFVTKTAVGFVPVTTANVISGTATNNSAAAGVYGVSIGASITLKMAIPLPIGQIPVEGFAPYQEYNAPLTYDLVQNTLTVYYSVAGATLTSATIGIYATNYSSSAPVVTTLLAQAQNGLGLTVGTYAVSINLQNLPNINVPNSVIVVELDMASTTGGSAIINGVAYN